MSSPLASVTMSCALILSACSRPNASAVVIPTAEAPTSGTTEPPPPAASTAPETAGAPDDCDHLFAAPANAVKLCEEHDNAVDSELHWQSYATTESRVDVNRRYREWASRCHFGFVTKPPIFSVTNGPIRLSSHDASPVDYPTCEKKASAEHKTVIVIATKLDH